MSERAYSAVPFADVRITGPFWRERLETVLKHTIPSQHAKLEEVGILGSLKLPKPIPPLTIPRNSHNFTMQVFWDFGCRQVDRGGCLRARSSARC